MDMLALHNTSAQPRGLVFRSHLVLTLGAQTDQTMLATSIICIHMTSLDLALQNRFVFFAENNEQTYRMVFSIFEKC